MSLFTLYFIKPSIHFLSYCALLLICGIIAGAYYSLVTIISIGILVFIPIAAFLRRPPITFLCLASFIVGAWRYQSTIKAHLEFSQILSNKPFSIQGTVISIDPQDHPRMKQKLTIQTDAFTPEGYRENHSKRIIQIYLTKKTDAKVADHIKIHGLILKKNNNQSYEHYLIKEQISATLFLPSLNYTLINRPTISYARWLFYFKEDLLYRCKKKLSRSTFSFFASVFLGNKMYEKKQMEKPKDNCKTWGISHYLARSGLHMIIFMYLCYLLLGLFPLPFTFKQIIFISIGILYYILSWPSISFIRAFISFLLFKSCSLLQVSSQLLHLFSIVTIGVLLYNPMQLFFLDFQLSFGLTFALAWFNHVMSQKYCLVAKY